MTFLRDHEQMKLIRINHTRQLSTQVRSRQLRSSIWIPQARLQDEIKSDANDLLIRAGYMYQAYAGIFHMLPLGLRVQSKLERLIDKHMQSLNASKISLSSLSRQSLWQKSGRWKAGGEFFGLQDRKGTEFLLAPTHEEEITQLAQQMTFSPSQLPARLYQIGRKYRDEKRPRGGLLRGREFLMKDLYTFDKTKDAAHSTYDDVRQAYVNLFDELKVPYIQARADSGNMGGNLSHEFHFPSNLGEDNLITCSNCDYARNEEFVPEINISQPQSGYISGNVAASFVANPNTLVRVITDVDVNPFTVKAALKGIVNVDTGHSDAEAWYDERKSSGKPVEVLYLSDSGAVKNGEGRVIHITSQHNRNILARQQTGDKCPDCDGTLTVQKAIEIGHTFHLGDRYTSKFGFRVPQGKESVEMGCHGIGVSRLIAAAASANSGVGLVWPKVIAPFEVCIITKDVDGQGKAEELYDNLDGVDVLIDERDVGLGWKLKDATLIGYPILLVIGSKWKSDGLLEVQCQKLGFRELVKAEEAVQMVHRLLDQA